MKTLLKLTVIVSFILAAASVSAQDKKLTPGIKAGMNISNFTGDLDLDAKIGFNVGFTLDYALTPDAYLLTGLELSTKGAKKSVSGASVNINAMYINLPIHFGYKVTIADNARLVFRGGPYLAYGIAGKSKIKGGDIEEKVNTFSTGGLKEFDFGLGIGTGVEFNEFGVNLGYDFGVLNISDDSSGKIRNGNFYISLGYKF